jgi:hypothetical protein
VCSLKIFSTVVKTYIKPFGEPFKVTPKGVSVTEASSEGKRLLTFLNMMIIALIAGSIFALAYTAPEKMSSVTIAVYWALTTAFSLLIARQLIKEKPRYRTEERFKLDDNVILYDSKTDTHKSYSINDVSLGGISVQNSIKENYDYVQFNNGIQLPIIKIRTSEDANITTYAYKEITDREEEKLTLSLFNKYIIPERRSSLSSFVKALRRLV